MGLVAYYYRACEPQSCDQGIMRVYMGILVKHGRLFPLVTPLSGWSYSHPHRRCIKYDRAKNSQHFNRQLRYLQYSVRRRKRLGLKQVDVDLTYRTRTLSRHNPVIIYTYKHIIIINI